MTHDEILAQNLAERYVTGKLSPEESVRFEEHFVDCPACLDRMESAQRLRAALKRAVGSEAKPPVAITGWVWPRAIWLAAAVVIAALGLSAWLMVRSSAMRRELQQARSAAASWQGRYEAERAKAGSTTTTPLAASTFFLNLTRDGGAASPVNSVTLRSDPQWVVLALEGGFDPAFSELRAALTDSKRNFLWQQSGLHPASGVPLSVVVPSTLLEPGDYVVAIEGQVAGRFVRAAQYGFRVITH